MGRSDGMASTNDYDLFLIDANDNCAGQLNQHPGRQPGPHRVHQSVHARMPTRARASSLSRTRARRTAICGSTRAAKLAVATAGQTFGHSAAQDAVGVAAVRCAGRRVTRAAFSTARSRSRRFSSDGPRRMFFEADGTPITADNFSSTGGRVLDKPDLTAADGVATSTPWVLGRSTAPRRLRRMRRRLRP